MTRKDKSEALALLARNDKTRASAGWDQTDAAGRRKPVLRSRLFEKAAALYEQGYAQDLNNYYPGLNALKGGDILFHEVCAELGVATRVLLTLPEGPFIAESVAHGGAEWVRRFNELIKTHPPQILQESKDLPRWMRGREDYKVWQRTNVWLLEETLTTGARVQTLIALWDGESGDGPGGTKHLVELAGRRGLTPKILPTKVIFASSQA